MRHTTSMAKWPEEGEVQTGSLLRDCSTWRLRLDSTESNGIVKAC